jgi:hypothetical protein
MLTGEPASKIPNQFSALNENVIDFGDYYKVRSGSRPYTSWRWGIEISSVDVSGNEITLKNTHDWITGDIVYLSGVALPSPFAEGTAYWIISTATNKVKLATSYANAIAGTAINITADGDGWVFWGEINAEEDHDSKGVLVRMYGQCVYIFDKAMTTMKKVLNVHGTNPDGVSWMQKHGDDVFLFSAIGGIFKIILDTEPWMHPVNLPVPSVLIVDVVETVTKIYGYLHGYSFSILAGTGNRSRLDSEILFESAMNLVDGQIKDYGEVYYDTEPGADLAVTHEVGTYTLPDTVLCVTHFTDYRSRNIGESSGGVSSSINGIGNRRDLFIYTADIPVAKAFLIDVAANVATLLSGNEFVLGDVSCTLKDHNGNTASISVFNSGTSTDLGAGLNGTSLACAIGGGRVMKASQTGNILTINDGTDTFVSGDVGLMVFVSDGTYRYVKRYISTVQVEVLDSDDFTELAITMKPLSGNFSRKWNDTVPDDPTDISTVSLKDFYEYGTDIYVPRRQCKPIPSSDCGMIGNGFMVAAPRDGMRYYYSQIGDKDYHIGYYRDPTQAKKVGGTIRHIVKFPFRAIVLMRKQTGSLALNNSQNVGNSEVGENIFELPEMGIVDPKRGVNLWQTLQFKNEGLLYAFTDDGAFRSFDGTAWSVQNFAYQSGRDAVSRYYLQKLDQATRLVSHYSPYGGFKLWMTRNLPNTTPSATVYQVIQEVESGEEDTIIQDVEDGEEDTIYQEIGVING